MNSLTDIAIWPEFDKKEELGVNTVRIILTTFVRMEFDNRYYLKCARSIQDSDSEYKSFEMAINSLTLNVYLAKIFDKLCVSNNNYDNARGCYHMMDECQLPEDERLLSKYGLNK